MSTLVVGVPSEIKDNENRVALTPDGVCQDAPSIDLEQHGGMAKPRRAQPALHRLQVCAIEWGVADGAVSCPGDVFAGTGTS